MAKGCSEVFTVMLEPVKSCNLRCRHCYSDIEDGGVMSIGVLNLVLEKIVRYTEQNGFKEIHFIWHGGEPLLAGIDFFKHAVTVLYRLASEVSCRHFIQTNGLLLDDGFCIFFRDMDFEVGISLDGPADVHDQLRVTQSGRGTHAAVMEKVRLLERHHVPIGFSTVVSSVSKGREQRIYRFFRDLGYNFRINPMIPAYNHNKTKEYLLHEGEYGNFLCRLFDEWTQTETQRITPSPLDIYLYAVLEGEPAECQQQFSCIGAYLGIKPNGETVLCTRFQNHALGDIREMTILEIFSSPLCKQIQRRADALSECRSCVNWSICHGGCPHNTIAFSRNLKEKDPFCTDYQMIFAHIRNTLRQYSNSDIKQTRR